MSSLIFQFMVWLFKFSEIQLDKTIGTSCSELQRIEIPFASARIWGVELTKALRTRFSIRSVLCALLRMDLKSSSCRRKNIRWVIRHICAWKGELIRWFWKPRPPPFLFAVAGVPLRCNCTDHIHLCRLVRRGGRRCLFISNEPAITSSATVLLRERT